MAELKEVLDYIRTADAGDMELISQVVTRRKQAVSMMGARELANTVAIGDKLAIKNSKPKYLNGRVGIVKDTKGDKILLDMGGPIGKFRGMIWVPLTCLERM